MEFDEWLKAGNGARRDESLEDAMRRTANSAFDFPIACPNCRSENLTCPNNNSFWHCEKCNHTWRH